MVADIEECQLYVNPKANPTSTYRTSKRLILFVIFPSKMTCFHPVVICLTLRTPHVFSLEKSLVPVANLNCQVVHFSENITSQNGTKKKKPIAEPEITTTTGSQKNVKTCHQKYNIRTISQHLNYGISPSACLCSLHSLCCH